VALDSDETVEGGVGYFFVGGHGLSWVWFEGDFGWERWWKDF